MADRRALGRLGWAFGAVTAAVLLMAAAVVTSHLDGRASAGEARFVAAAAPTSSAHDFASLFQPR
jgi:hypothetical protein